MIRARSVKRLSVCVFAAVLGCVALEFALRWLIFGESELARTWGARWRSPALYADWHDDEEYWKFSYVVAHDPHPIQAHLYHPKFGWVSEAIDPKTLLPRAPVNLNQRRPILLFGDSFAQCNTDPSECFEALLAASPLSKEYVLFNYGVRGYGLDQVALLASEVVAKWAPRNPIVVIGVCVDECLDRSMLAFRGWPKPYFRVEDGALALHGVPVPSTDDYLKQFPLSIASFAWRALVHSSPLVPEFVSHERAMADSRVESKCALNRRIFQSIDAELSARNLEHFVWLFHSRPYLQSQRALDWRESFGFASLRELGVPFTTMKFTVREDACIEGVSVNSYYGVKGLAREHLNAVGNRVAFAALERGLAKHFDSAAVELKFLPKSIDVGGDRVDGRVVSCIARGASSRFPEAVDAERWIVRALEGQPTTARVTPPDHAKLFGATLHAVEHGSSGGCVASHVTISVGSRVVLDATLDHASPAQPLAIELAGSAPLVVRVEAASGSAVSDALVFASPRFD